MNKQELSNALSTYGGCDDDHNHDMKALAGPVAAHIERLEARILELEKRPIPKAKVQAGASSIDTRDGLSVSDVIELVRALRDK